MERSHVEMPEEALRARLAAIQEHETLTHPSPKRKEQLDREAGRIVFEPISRQNETLEQ